ncbi:MAG: hypothetical protein JWQ89_1638 [Devosia sp.]|uniref:hypothetical protein n=1 Tax=Devosia sp. TaxID=1871048 RepID=UPI002606E52C|nr:hypothetical protein [Devosia sp.]MDB5539911.1 hypothetical protein [Devosia sp.]
MTIARMTAAAVLITTLMFAAIAPAAPAYAGSAEVARGITGAIYAGAGEVIGRPNICGFATIMKFSRWIYESVTSMAG